MVDKGAIIYGSRRGKVKQLAGLVNSVFQEQGLNWDLMDIKGASSRIFLQYPMFIAASSTWGQGDLQEDWDDVERELRDMDLSGRRFACFGTGNSRFTYFCDAPDILEARLTACGAGKLTDSLKLDVLDSTIEEQLRTWSRDLAEKIRATK